MSYQLESKDMRSYYIFDSSVVGLNFDYVLFSMCGYIMYNNFNAGLFFIPEIKVSILVTGNGQTQVFVPQVDQDRLYEWTAERLPRAPQTKGGHVFFFISVENHHKDAITLM